MNNIEAKLAKLFDSPIENKLQAFISVEEDIGKVLDSIQKHKFASSPPISKHFDEPCKDKEQPFKPPSVNICLKPDNIRPSTPSVVEEAQSDSEMHNLSKNTLDEVESQIMESFENDMVIPNQVDINIKLLLGYSVYDLSIEDHLFLECK